MGPGETTGSRSQPIRPDLTSSQTILAGSTQRMYHRARHLGKEAYRKGSSGEGEGSSPLRYTEGENKTSQNCSSVDDGPRVPQADELDYGSSFACSIASPILSGSLREERKGSWERAFLFFPLAFKAWEDEWKQISGTP